MNICFFGNYDRNYSSNQIFLRGFAQVGAKVTEVGINTPITPLISDNQTGLAMTCKRILGKLTIIPKVIEKLSDISKTDVIFVGYPGHFDVPLAYVLAKLLRKRLVFYPVIVLTVTFADDVRLLNRRSWKLKLLEIFEKFIYNLCDLIITDGPIQLEYIKEHFSISGIKIKSVYLGANDAIYRYENSPKKHKGLNVVYYGLYSPLHGIEYLLKAAKLCEIYSDIHFQLIGNGQVYDEMRALASRLKLVNVQFYPHIREANAKEYLDQADVFVGFLSTSPSVERMIPNKVYQGMALGKVVLTAESRIMNLAFTPGKDILLCSAAKPEEIAKSIIWINNNPGKMKAIRVEANKSYKSKFTPMKVASKIADLIS